jgi:cyclase
VRLASRFSLVAVATVAVSLSTWAQGQGIDYAKIEILTEKVAPNLYMLAGSAGADPGHQDAAGGRIGVLAGPDGIFMVDAQYAQLADKVLAAIRKISSEPIRFLVNTHVHGDHTAGNANFVKMGALLFAREELREELSRPPATPAGGNTAPARDPARLPVVTYGMGDPVKLRMDGEIVDLIPVRAAHTGGDTMIRFENADVIMIVDFYRNYGYPFIDTNNGGTLKGARLIPGHRTIINRTDIVPYRDTILGRGRRPVRQDGVFATEGRQVRTRLGCGRVADHSATVHSILSIRTSCDTDERALT